MIVDWVEVEKNYQFQILINDENSSLSLEIIELNIEKLSEENRLIKTNIKLLIEIDII